MSIAKVIEVLAEGNSIEAAIQAAVTEAAETVRGIKQFYTGQAGGVGPCDPQRSA